MRNITLLLLTTIGLISFSCKPKNSYFISPENPKLNLHFTRFDQEFNSLKDKDISTYKYTLEKNYRQFFPIYNQGIISIGNITDEKYYFLAHKFLNDSIYCEVYDTVQAHFPNMKKYEEDFSTAFRRYNAIFPTQKIPTLYTHISGFHEPIVVADSLLSISLENYLGSDHVFYKRLGTYNYVLNHKNSEHMVCDAMRGWVSSELNLKSHSTLLDHIIHEGKILFILQQILPEEQLYNMIGITEEQYMWCEKYKADTWKYMIEKKHLFSNQNLIITKYIKDGPFFSFVGSGSSPMVGKYIGYLIVNNYMTKNHNVSINDLINEKNSQHILEESHFKP